jgi:tetratricopeptide (TPR) repeat protein
VEVAYRILGEARLLDGGPSQARAHLRRALERARRNGSAEREVVCLVRLSEVELAAGDLQTASRLAESACRKAAEGAPGSLMGLAFAARGKALLARGEPGLALSDLLAAERAWSERRALEDLSEAAFHLGKAYRELGRRRFASLYFRKALDAVEEVCGGMESEGNRARFLSDPRQKRIFEAIRGLRRSQHSD